MLRHVLITGASGFLGSQVARRMAVDSSVRIVAIVRKTGGFPGSDELAAAGVRFEVGNYFDRGFVRAVFERYPIRYVVHLAGLSGVGVGAREDYLRLNVAGAEALLEASLEHGIARYIHCSSVGVFGTIPSALPAGTGTALRADNSYHLSKILAEHKVEDFVRQGLDAFVVRPTITYGAGTERGFPAVLVGLVKRRLLLLPGRDIKIHLLDVDCFADSVIKMLWADRLRHRVYILADEAPISLRELVDAIHLRYYRKRYPRLLRLPTWAFKAGTMVSAVFKSERWATRLMLMSRSWHYDISETLNAFPYAASKTKDTFIKSMCG